MILAAADDSEISDIEVHTLGGAICCIYPPLPIPTFNRVMVLGLREPASEQIVDQIDRLYRERDLPTFVQISPAAQPSSIPSWLEARGFAHTDNWTKFYRSVDSPPKIETDLQIEEIGPDRAGDLAAVMAAGFGIPPDSVRWMRSTVGRAGWRHYLAYDGTSPVAAAALFIRGSVGALEGAATLSTHRGRGAQGALMARRIRDAADMGCTWVTTETGEQTSDRPNPSYRNMLRTEFRIAYNRPNYMRPPPGRDA
jgi:GNAT superfamily N-acetyltransferase